MGADLQAVFDSCCSSVQSRVTYPVCTVWQRKNLVALQAAWLSRCSSFGWHWKALPYRLGHDGGAKVGDGPSQQLGFRGWDRCCCGCWGLCFPLPISCANCPLQLIRCGLGTFQGSHCEHPSTFIGSGIPESDAAVEMQYLAE